MFLCFCLNVILKCFEEVYKSLKKKHLVFCFEGENILAICRELLKNKKAFV